MTRFLERFRRQIFRTATGAPTTPDSGTRGQPVGLLLLLTKAT
jgi:hypothetical protein